MDEEMEYEDSAAGRFEEFVDKIVEVRRSVFDTVCDQIKNVSSSITGGSSDDDDEASSGPIASIVDTVSSVDQAIVQGTADVIKSIGRTVLGIF